MIIINADDFGASESVNLAITAGFEHNIISSTTIMANMPAFEDACERATLGGFTDRIGIHINITEGHSLTDAIRAFPKFYGTDGVFCFRRNRNWYLSPAECAALAEEVGAQIQRCRAIGLALTHADSHHHVHTEPAVFKVIRPVLRDYAIRSLRNSENSSKVPKSIPILLYKKAFNIWLKHSGFKTTDMFSGLNAFDMSCYLSRDRSECWEIMVHPVYSNNEIIDSEDGLPLFPRLKKIIKKASPVPYSSLEEIRRGCR